MVALNLGTLDPIARAETEAQRQERERRMREEALFGNLGRVNSAQSDLARNAAAGNRNASQLSNLLGRNSIGRGVRHIRHGRSHHNRPEVRTGYFEVAQGILGLLASAAAGRNGDVSGGRADRLGDAGSAGVTGAIAQDTGAGTAGETVVSGNATASSRLSADGWRQVISDLDTDDAKSAFKEIEEEYGITKKELLTELRAGRDGTYLLENAKKNPEARDEIQAALKEARDRSSHDSAAETGGGRGLASVAAPVPASETAPVAAEPSYYANALGKAANARSLRDELRARLGEESDDQAGEQQVSPEVRQALAARERQQAADRAREVRAHATIFDLVHAKYSEREGMIRGWIKSPGAESVTE